MYSGGNYMKKKMVKRLMAASMAGTLAVTMFAGCGSSSDSKDNSSAKTEDSSEDNSDKPDTWIADRTITVQAYVDDIGNTLPEDFNNTETMKDHRADRYQTGCKIYTW